ncbi:hypothetical protein JBE04_41175, partial [Streptomyces sp. PRKS01-29]
MADLDERLRDIARDVEPSIRLADPEAVRARGRRRRARQRTVLSLIHLSEPTRHSLNSYAVFCLKKKNINENAP